MNRIEFKLSGLSWFVAVRSPDAAQPEALDVLRDTPRFNPGYGGG